MLDKLHCRYFLGAMMSPLGSFVGAAAALAVYKIIIYDAK